MKENREKDSSLEAKIAILNIVQNIISRLSQNSFLVKGWEITLIASIITLEKTFDQKIGLIIIFISVCFYFLDSYFLYLERKARKLYNQKARENIGKINFFIIEMNKIKDVRYCGALFSKAAIFHYILILITILFFIINLEGISQC